MTPSSLPSKCLVQPLNTGFIEVPCIKPYPLLTNKSWKEACSSKVFSKVLSLIPPNNHKDRGRRAELFLLLWDYYLNVLWWKHFKSNAFPLSLHDAFIYWLPRWSLHLPKALASNSLPFSLANLSWSWETSKATHRILTSSDHPHTTSAIHPHVPNPHFVIYWTSSTFEALYSQNLFPISPVFWP